MRNLSSLTLVAVGVIHLLPLSGVLGGAQLKSLYGVVFDEPNSLILMQHRAVLFGVVGFFLAYAAVRPAFQPTAFAVGLVSVLAFLWLAGRAPGHNASLARVVAVDWFAFVLLIVGIAARLYTRTRNSKTSSE